MSIFLYDPIHFKIVFVFQAAGQESSFPPVGQYPYPSGFPPMGGGAYPSAPSSGYPGAGGYSTPAGYPAPGGYLGAPQPGGAPSYPGGELWVMELVKIWDHFNTFSFFPLSSSSLLVLYGSEFLLAFSLPWIVRT